MTSPPGRGGFRGAWTFCKPIHLPTNRRSWPWAYRAWARPSCSRVRSTSESRWWPRWVAAWRCASAARAGATGRASTKSSTRTHIGSVPGSRSSAGRPTNCPATNTGSWPWQPPRSLFTRGNPVSDQYGNANAAAQTYLGAKSVYAFLGVPDNLGVSFRSGQHGMNATDWEAILDFADQKLPKRGGNRRFDQLPPAEQLH